MVDEILGEAEERMGKAIDFLKRDLSMMRTGRASPVLVENIKVEYYGVPTPLKQIASITVPEARQLLIQPWDKNSIPSIEKAIVKSDLGVMPSVDKEVIRINFPPLTEERRKELVRVVRKRGEDGKIAIRNVRRDALEDIRKLYKEKKISEDEERRAIERLQKITDRFIDEATKLGKLKEEEIMEE